MDDADAGGAGVARPGETNRLSFEQDPPLEVGLDSRQDFHQSAFSGAVLTADGAALPALDRERNTGQSDDARKAFRDLLHHDEGHRVHRSTSPAAARCRFRCLLSISLTATRSARTAGAAKYPAVGAAMRDASRPVTS